MMTGFKSKKLMSSNEARQIRMFYIEPKTKYKFSRKWHQAYFNLKDYDDVDEWCEQQFGKHPARPDAWSRWWHKFEDSILFRDEKDYVLFTLRWS